MSSTDALAQFKEAQKVGWGLFAPMELFTIPTAARLVEFAQVKPNQAILDCACGTGVVAITAARKGAKVKALDLAPALLERARENATLSEVEIEFTEGDVESLPYQDEEFDMVLSQYGHMFAPRPEVAVKEMLRVLKPGGRIAFSTWPPDHFVGKLFAIVGKHSPPPAGVTPPPTWGNSTIVSERLGSAVKDLVFDRAEMQVAALSPQHVRNIFEKSTAPLAKIASEFKNDPAKLKSIHAEIDELVSTYSKDNIVRQSYLMTRATKI